MDDDCGDSDDSRLVARGLAFHRRFPPAPRVAGPLLLAEALHAFARCPPRFHISGSQSADRRACCKCGGGQEDPKAIGAVREEEVAIVVVRGRAVQQANDPVLHVAHGAPDGKEEDLDGGREEVPAKEEKGADTGTNQVSKLLAACTGIDPGRVARAAAVRAGERVANREEAPPLATWGSAAGVRVQAPLLDAGSAAAAGESPIAAPTPLSRPQRSDPHSPSIPTMSTLTDFPKVFGGIVGAGLVGSGMGAKLMGGNVMHAVTTPHPTPSLVGMRASPCRPCFITTWAILLSIGGRIASAAPAAAGHSCCGLHCLARPAVGLGMPCGVTALLREVAIASPA